MSAAVFVTTSIHFHDKWASTRVFMSLWRCVRCPSLALTQQSTRLDRLLQICVRTHILVLYVIGCIFAICTIILSPLLVRCRFSMCWIQTVQPGSQYGAHTSVASRASGWCWNILDFYSSVALQVLASVQPIRMSKNLTSGMQFDWWKNTFFHYARSASVIL